MRGGRNTTDSHLHASPVFVTSPGQHSKTRALSLGYNTPQFNKKASRPCDVFIPPHNFDQGATTEESDMPNDKHIEMLISI
jgi:hypothetical protein